MQRLVILLSLAAVASADPLPILRLQKLAATNAYSLTFGCEVWRGSSLDVQMSTNMVNWTTIPPLPGQFNSPVRNYLFTGVTNPAAMFFRVNPR